MGARSTLSTVHFLKLGELCPREKPALLAGLADQCATDRPRLKATAGQFRCLAA